MFKINTLIVCTVIALLVSSCFFKPLPFDEKKWIETVENTDQEMIYADNFKQGRYFNPWLKQENRSFWAFLRWRLSQKSQFSEAAMNNLPKIQPKMMQRVAALSPSEDFIAWVGHATFLIRLQGEYWLTDPIFSDRALLPKRVTPPAIVANDLAALDGDLHVVLSHNHYDHLDRESLASLPEKTSFYVPMGLADYVSSFVNGKVTEMNWWDKIEPATGMKLTCLPAQHWSRRLFQGYNTTLWASYLIETEKKTIYFGGDSGYFKGYREIGKRYPAIDYALMPVTAYQPRWFMHYPHMDTREAIRAFQDLGAAYFIPTQWGTFHLGDNPPGLPPLDLLRNIKAKSLDPSHYLLLDIGEIRLL